MILKNIQSKKGFTLIELMLVLFIIGILSSVAIPLMTGRSDAAKWMEGKSIAGTIRTSARAYCAERGPAGTYDGSIGLDELGFALRSEGDGVSDLDGKYFSEECCQIAFTGYNTYTITITAADAIGGRDYPTVPAVVTLTSAGDFSY